MGWKGGRGWGRGRGGAEDYSRLHPLRPCLYFDTDTDDDTESPGNAIGVKLSFQGHKSARTFCVTVCTGSTSVGNVVGSGWLVLLRVTSGESTDGNTCMIANE